MTTSKEGSDAIDNVTTFSTSSPDIGWYDANDHHSYTLLPPDEISRRLVASSKLESQILGDGVRVDSIEFQPNPTELEPKEDRAVTCDFAWLQGRGTLLCVFDGHIGVDLVEHTTSVLPGALMTSLQTLPADAPPSAVSALLAREIQAFDDALLKAVSDVFPERELERMTNDEISERMKDRDVERKVILASRGTTALFCLISPDKRSHWTANVGDCQALLATRSTESEPWLTPLEPVFHLTSPHGASAPAEVARLQAAHPDEAETVIHNGRLLGQIAVTRALGDAMYKMPAVYVDKIFARHGPSRIQAKIERLLPLYLTPPYMNASPTVVFTPLPPPRGGPHPTVLLFLCSDGLKDHYDRRPFESKTLEDEWVTIAGDSLDRKGERANVALAVVDDALGGRDDIHRRSASLTLRLPDGGKFSDDTTVVVASW